MRWCVAPARGAPVFGQQTLVTLYYLTRVSVTARGPKPYLHKLGKPTIRDPDRREQSLIAHFTLLASGHRTHLRTVFRAAHEGSCSISKIAIFPYKSVIVAAFLAHDHHRQHGQDGLNSVQCGHLRGCGGSQLGGERSTVYALSLIHI